VTKITNFGVFIELEQDLEGLLHVSELTDRKIEDPHEEVEIGQELEVKILRVDTHERKIGLSKKRADWAADSEETGERKHPGAPKPRRGGLHGAGEETTDYISPTALLNDPPLARANEKKDQPSDDATAPDSEVVTENNPDAPGEEAKPGS
jgi:small subunit ribosomal protein S1